MWSKLSVWQSIYLFLLVLLLDLFKSLKSSSWAAILSHLPWKSITMFWLLMILLFDKWNLKLFLRFHDVWIFTLQGVIWLLNLQRGIHMLKFLAKRLWIHCPNVQTKINEKETKRKKLFLCNPQTQFRWQKGSLWDVKEEPNLFS